MYQLVFRVTFKTRWIQKKKKMKQMEEEEGGRYDRSVVDGYLIL